MTSCTTQRLIENQKSRTENHESRIENRESRIENRESIIDSIHILTIETLWLPPDTLGRQYPLKTIHRESGGNRIRDSEKTYQKKDTCYLQSTTINHQTSTLNHEPSTLNRKTNTWLPWLILAGLILITIIIVLRILIIRL